MLFYFIASNMVHSCVHNWFIRFLCLGRAYNRIVIEVQQIYCIYYTHTKYNGVYLFILSLLPLILSDHLLALPATYYPPSFSLFIAHHFYRADTTVDYSNYRQLWIFGISCYCCSHFHIFIIYIHKRSPSLISKIYPVF